MISLPLRDSLPIYFNGLLMAAYSLGNSLKVKGIRYSRLPDRSLPTELSTNGVDSRPGNPEARKSAIFQRQN
jgi:hypothetical protein